MRKSMNTQGETFWTLEAPGGLEVTIRATESGLDIGDQHICWRDVDAAKAAAKAEAERGLAHYERQQMGAGH